MHYGVWGCNREEVNRVKTDVYTKRQVLGGREAEQRDVDARARVCVARSSSSV